MGQSGTGLHPLSKVASKTANALLRWGRGVNGTVNKRGNRVSLIVCERLLNMGVKRQRRWQQAGMIPLIVLLGYDECELLS